MEPGGEGWCLGRGTDSREHKARGHRRLGSIKVKRSAVRSTIGEYGRLSIAN